MVFFNHTGKHYLWVRGSGDTNSAGRGSSDSIHVGLNGTVASTAFRIDNFPEEWSWSRHTPSDPIASLNIVDAGVNVINFWMREDGLAFDKFVITSDPDFVPTGRGPDVTDGTDDYVPPTTIIPETQDVQDVQSPAMSDSESVQLDNQSAGLNLDHDGPNPTQPVSNDPAGLDAEDEIAVSVSDDDPVAEEDAGVSETLESIDNSVVPII